MVGLLKSYGQPKVLGNKKKCATRKRRFKSSWRFSVIMDLPLEISYHFWKTYRRFEIEVKCHLLRRRYVQQVIFNFNSFSTQECLRQFQFRPEDMKHILPIFNYHGRTGRRGYVCSEITAACILLRRISYPCRWFDLGKMFGVGCSKLSEIFWELSEWIYEHHHRLLKPFRAALMENRAPVYASKIRSAGAMLPHCIGFIDVTKIHVCRPIGDNELQQSLYSGHKRIHWLLFCTITTPDGLVFFCDGPVEGRRHDLYLLNQSGLDDAVRDSLLIDDVQYYVYGDAAYINHTRPWLLSGFPPAFITPFMSAFNTSNNRPRTSVEWNYKDVKQMFTSTDFKRSLKIRKSPVGLLYLLSCLLWNLKVCLHSGGQVGSFFECKPPSLHDYMTTFWFLINFIKVLNLLN